MSTAAKPRGLADLDALMPRAPAPKPKLPVPAPKPAVPKARTHQTPPARQSAPRQSVVSPPAPAQRLKEKIRGQVFYLPDRQIESLNRLSRQTERSKSDLVREAIANYLGPQ